jgi:hypothetical protein
MIPVSTFIINLQANIVNSIFTKLGFLKLEYKLRESCERLLEELAYGYGRFQ